MNDRNTIVSGTYSHDLLVHDNDRDLVAGTVAFVEQGLRSGGRVLVHSSEERVDLLRSHLGTHPRLDYGYDRDLYVSPMTTLFTYERRLAQRYENGDFWVTGTVPFGRDRADRAAWTRYESLVNEVLGRYPFHALCTYDTRTLPASTIDTARATHPCVSDGVHRGASPCYVDPAAFQADPRAASPSAPTAPPTATATLDSPHDLHAARHLIARTAEAASAVARDTIDSFVAATNEVLTNALQHGHPPVELRLWIETSTLTCLVDDRGPGVANPLAGFRYPEDGGIKGLWLARQLCEELVIRRSASGGCSVLVSTA